MKQPNLEELLKMSQSELNDHNAKKTMKILNELIKACQELKAVFNNAPKQSTERNYVMTMAMVFNNLLSEENVEKEIYRLQEETESFTQTIKAGAH